jgi:protease-4
MRRVVVFLLFVAIVFTILYALYPESAAIPDSAVLVVQLGGDLDESPPVDPLSGLLAEGLALPTLLLPLEKAAVDERVRGVLLQIRSLQVGYARIQELRDAIERVRRTGKPVAALIDLTSLNATRELYLASAAEHVYLVPGFVGPFAGIAGEYLFLGEMIEKVGVRMEYERMGEYKSAPESLAERKMSPETRVMLDQILDTLFQQIVVGIALGRDLEADGVKGLVDEAPATIQAYLEADLADGVASLDEVVELLGGEEAEQVLLQTYVDVDPRVLGLRTGPAIALVFGEGAIVQTSGRRGFGAKVFAADRVLGALREAVDDPEVQAIVLRINSPGGSPLASDEVWRAIRDAREQKPVVVSLADAAASGGYYIASAADAVIAEPATLTGSIGVFLLRPSLGELYEKIGVNAELLTRGRKAGVTTSALPLTPEQRELTREIVGSLYDQFLERVSEGRGMTAEQVDAVARGRVWLGETAHTLGLVDEVGGLQAAVERAKREAGIDPGADPARLVYPGPRSLAEQIQDLFGADTFAPWLAALGPLGPPDALRAWLHVTPGEPAYLPVDWLEIR